jgi:hypothetical protein
MTDIIDEVIEEIEEEEDLVPEHERIAGGGWRADQNKDQFWIPLKHLTEFERMNNSIEGDEEFWTWFDDFKKTAKLRGSTQNKRERKQRGQVDEPWVSKWTPSVKSASDYLHGWWKGYGYEGTSEVSSRLAIALGVISTTIQAVRSKAGRYRVKLASAEQEKQGPTSYTSLSDEEIVVSPAALLDPKLDERAAIEISTGWGLHEAGHTEWTEEPYNDIIKPFPLAPKAVAAILLNVLEDVRIERLMGEGFPGFAPYFQASLDYLWTIPIRDEAGKLVQKNGTWVGTDLNDKINWVIRTLRWPKEFKEIIDKELRQGLPNAGNSVVEFDWWRGLLADYDEGRLGARETLIEALARLASSDEKTQQEMKDQQQQEEAIDRAIKDLQGQIDAAIKELKKKGPIIDVCPAPTPGKPTGADKVQTAKVSEATAKEIDELVAENMQKDKPNPVYADAWAGKVPPTIVRRPLETEASREMWTHMNRPDPLTGRLRGAFIFRPADPEYSTRLLKSGSIDEEELWRAKTGDYRVFEQRTIESKPDTDITILIDQSGSMSGHKLATAARLTMLVQAIIATTQGTTLRVRSHTNNVNTGDDTSIFRIWERGDSQSRLALPETLPQMANQDGWAIGWCIDELLKTGKQGNQKLLIVMSDGIPAGHGYTGAPAMDHVRKVTDAGERMGVTTVQIAIGGSQESNQKRMYKHYIIFKSDMELPRDLTKILTKIL